MSLRSLRRQILHLRLWREGSRFSSDLLLLVNILLLPFKLVARMVALRSRSPAAASQQRRSGRTNRESRTEPSLVGALLLFVPQGEKSCANENGQTHAHTPSRELHTTNY